MSKLTTADALNQHFSRLSNCGLSAAYLMYGFGEIAKLRKEHQPSVSIAYSVKKALRISEGQMQRKAIVDFLSLPKNDESKVITVFKGCSVGLTTLSSTCLVNNQAKSQSLGFPFFPLSPKFTSPPPSPILIARTHSQ